MNVIEKLKNNIEAATGWPFVYGSQGDINRVLDRAPLPCAFAYLLETNAVNDTNGICRERLTLVVFFVKKTTFDFEAIENESIIDECKRTALLWYTANRTQGDFRFVSMNSTMRVYDEIADATVTGYALNLTIDEIEGVSACQLPKPKPTIVERVYTWDYQTNKNKSDKFDLTHAVMFYPEKVATFGDGSRFVGCLSVGFFDVSSLIRTISFKTQNAGGKKCKLKIWTNKQNQADTVIIYFDMKYKSGHGSDGTISIIELEQVEGGGNHTISTADRSMFLDVYKIELTDYEYTEPNL